MAIRTVVTRGYGNGVFSGTIPLVALRGYRSTIAEVVLPAGRTLVIPAESQTLVIRSEVRTVTIPNPGA